MTSLVYDPPQIVGVDAPSVDGEALDWAALAFQQGPSESPVPQDAGVAAADIATDLPADTDDPDHVEFIHVAEGGSLGTRRNGRGAAGPVWPLVTALGVSVFLHAGVIAGMLLLVAMGVITPPRVPFAQGDGSATAGRVDLPGEANRVAGRPGEPLELPPLPLDAMPADAAAEPLKPPPSEALVLPPIEPPSPAETPRPVDVPAEPEPADVTDTLPPADEMIARAPAMPKRNWSFPEPAVEPPTTERLEHPATRPTTAPAERGRPDIGDAVADASPDTARANAGRADAGRADAAHANASRTGSASHGAEARPASGTGHADGQGGAATGAGGTDVTGRPGIPAGLPIGGLPQPVYPEVSRRLGEQGRVLLAVEILADGRVGDIQVESDAGYPRLAASAVERLRGARVPFTPARDAFGQPIRSVVRIPYDFTLHRR